MMETCPCTGCGIEVLEDDGAECTDCGKAIVACSECVTDGAWLTCTECFDAAHDERPWREKEASYGCGREHGTNDRTDGCAV